MLVPNANVADLPLEKERCEFVRTATSAWFKFVMVKFLSRNHIKEISCKGQPHHL